MRLFKYTSEKGLSVLRFAEIAVTPPCDFNDPFEFIPVITGYNPARETALRLEDPTFVLKLAGILRQKGIYKGTLDNFAAFLRSKPHLVHHLQNVQLRATMTVRDQMQKLASQQIGVFCTSTVCNDPLMWSHYGNSHKGLIIEFEMDDGFFPENAPIKVIYSEKRPKVNFEREFNAHEYKKQLEKLMCSKSSIWEYENEYRQFFYLNECTKRECEDKKERYFYAINLKCIKRIIVGCRVKDDTIKEIKMQLSKEGNDHIVLEKAFIDDDYYEIKSKPI